MTTNPIHYQINNEFIIGDQFGEATTLPSILFLHGGGTSCRQRFRRIRQGLVDNGLSSVAFDFSGHGESSSQVPGSLSKRFNESLPWWSMLKNSPIRCIIGFSMGAEVAVRLAMTTQIKATHLILVAGAFYNRAAFEVPFGEAFSSIIRVPGSWQDAEAFDLLERFDGHLTILSAEHDAVIPDELHPMMLKNAKSAQSAQHIVLNGMNHMAGLQCEQEPLFAKKFISVLLNSLR